MRRIFRALILTRVDFRKALPATLLAAVPLAAASCARPGARASNVNSGPVAADANAASSNAPNSPYSPGGGEYEELLTKVSELVETTSAREA